MCTGSMVVMMLPMRHLSHNCMKSIHCDRLSATLFIHNLLLGELQGS